MVEFEGVRSPCGTWHHEGDHVAHVDAGWEATKASLHEAHIQAYIWERQCERKYQHYLAVEAGEEDW